MNAKCSRIGQGGDCECHLSASPPNLLREHFAFIAKCSQMATVIYNFAGLTHTYLHWFKQNQFNYVKTAIEYLNVSLKKKKAHLQSTVICSKEVLSTTSPTLKECYVENFL